MKSLRCVLSFEYEVHAALEISLWNIYPRDVFRKGAIPRGALKSHLHQWSSALKDPRWNEHVDSCWREREGFLGHGLVQDVLPKCIGCIFLSIPSLLQCQPCWDSLIQRIKAQKNNRKQEPFFFLFFSSFFPLYFFSLWSGRQIQTVFP